MLARGSHIRSTTLASARQGGGREQRGAKRLGSERHGRERFHAATRGKAGKRLAFGLTLCTSFNQLADTSAPNIQKRDPGKGW